MFWNTGAIETLAPDAIYSSETGQYLVIGRDGKVSDIYETVLNKNRVVIAIRKIK